MKKITIQIEETPYQVLVADTDETRERGLMGVNKSKRYADKIINGERIEVGTEFFPDTDILPYSGTEYTNPSPINWNWRSELEKKLGHSFIY